MKKILSLLLVISVLTGYAAAFEPATRENGPAVSAKSAVLMDKETGTVLYEHNPHMSLPPASVTKVMSLLVICEALNDGKISLSDVVTISDHAAKMGGSQIYLSPGEKMSVEELLKAVVVVSANDAVVALGEFVSGSEAAFVAEMNARAKELNMLDTTFMNASGLDHTGHVTSAYDIAVMSRELVLTYPSIETYSTIWMDTVRDGQFQLANTNKLIRTYNGATGLKTGYTSTAGSCLSATAKRDKTELICAILGAANSAERFADAASLLDYGFANYAISEVFPDNILLPVGVKLGKSASIQPELAAGNRVLIQKGKASSLTKSVELCESVDAPVEAGQELGVMNIYLDGELLKSVPIVSGESVERLSFGDICKNMLGRLFMAG